LFWLSCRSLALGSVSMMKVVSMGKSYESCIIGEYSIIYSS
jgi:hypothetical protein